MKNKLEIIIKTEFIGDHLNKLNAKDFLNYLLDRPVLIESLKINLLKTKK